MARIGSKLNGWKNSNQFTQNLYGLSHINRLIGGMLENKTKKPRSEYLYDLRVIDRGKKSTLYFEFPLGEKFRALHPS